MDNKAVEIYIIEIYIIEHYLAIKKKKENVTFRDSIDGPGDHYAE